MAPFGYERKQLEKELENKTSEPQTKRVYLDVIAELTSAGELLPISFKWDGRIYKIHQVLNSRSGQSLKQRISARRFICRSDRKVFELFFEDGGFGNQKFYIELL